MVNNERTLPIPTNAKQDDVEKKPRDAMHIAFIENPSFVFNSFIQDSICRDDKNNTIKQKQYILL